MNVYTYIKYKKHCNLYTEINDSSAVNSCQIVVMPEHYTFMASIIFFIALGILDKYLEKTTRITSALPPGSYKTSLDTSPLPKSLSLYWKQINRVKIKFVSMHASF